LSSNRRVVRGRVADAARPVFNGVGDPGLDGGNALELCAFVGSDASAGGHPIDWTAARAAVSGVVRGLPTNMILGHLCFLPRFAPTPGEDVQVVS